MLKYNNLTNLKCVKRYVIIQNHRTKHIRYVGGFFIDSYFSWKKAVSWKPFRWIHGEKGKGRWTIIIFWYRPNNELDNKLYANRQKEKTISMGPGRMINITSHTRDAWGKSNSTYETQRYYKSMSSERQSGQYICPRLLEPPNPVGSLKTKLQLSRFTTMGCSWQVFNPSNGFLGSLHLANL